MRVTYAKFFQVKLSSSRAKVSRLLISLSDRIINHRHSVYSSTFTLREATVFSRVTLFKLPSCVILVGSSILNNIYCRSNGVLGSYAMRSCSRHRVPD